jgi:hypothetical protein
MAPIPWPRQKLDMSRGVEHYACTAHSKLREAGDLGEDITISTERGDRSFAPGDRLMFLRNDRDLGVKNGTLGEIERASPTHMTVKLDDGRRIAFDTKNYAHLDHGYAATIHKSQGVTVDRTHVLATPRLDRHATYVALSRHREGVQVHYGRDDFADAGKLARTLSRERGKDMASDYPREREVDPARQFAARREIRSPVIRLPEPPQHQIEPQKVRSIFEGIKLDMPQPERQPRIFANFRPPAPDQKRDMAIGVEQKSLAPDLKHAVEKYARSLADIERARDRGLPPMPHQEAARDKGRKALDQVRPHAGRDANIAFNREPALVADAATGRTNAVIRAMQLEVEIRNNPQLRADRFVENWQKLTHERQPAYQHGGPGQFDRITKRMGEMAQGLGRDAQVESLLRNRTRELGISMTMGRDLSHDLSTSIGFGRGRGLGIGM